MVIEDKTIKNIIKYGLLTIIPLIIATILLGGYNLYISLMKSIDVNNRANNQTFYNSKNSEESKNIQRLSFLKYTHKNDNKDDPSIYLIELVRIGNCKYIIVSKKDQAPVIVHAHDCDNPIHKNEK